MTTPRFLDCGDTMLVVECAQTVSPEVNDRVLALDETLRVRALPGVIEQVPTFRSLAIHYDPLTIDRQTLVETIQDLLTTLDPKARPVHRWIFPVCYAPPHGEDLAEAAHELGRGPEWLAELHARGLYRIYMYGFAPGFAYLGGTPEVAMIPRRLKPRLPHPANAVMIGGGLSAIARFPMPTGWWVLGRTPERMFHAGRTPVFLAAVGDEIRFEAIDTATFDALDTRAANGEIVARREGAR